MASDSTHHPHAKLVLTEASPDVYPCWYFANGFCKYGTSCWYSHAVVQVSAPIAGSVGAGNTIPTASHSHQKRNFIRAQSVEITDQDIAEFNDLMAEARRKLRLEKKETNRLAKIARRKVRKDLAKEGKPNRPADVRAEMKRLELLEQCHPRSDSGAQSPKAQDTVPNGPAGGGYNILKMKRSSQGLRQLKSYGSTRDHKAQGMISNGSTGRGCDIVEPKRSAQSAASFPKERPPRYNPVPFIPQSQKVDATVSQPDSKDMAVETVVKLEPVKEDSVMIKQEPLEGKGGVRIKKEPVEEEGIAIKQEELKLGTRFLESSIIRRL